MQVTSLNQSSIGIIGGADGPTATFVSLNTQDLIIKGAVVTAVIAVAIALAVYLIKKHKK